MAVLAKIRDVSIKYNVSTRTLRYYEDMGLLQSVKSGDYSYRCYDEESLGRLEQILVLRKLNISIKDIQKVFSSNSVDALLAVLGHKVRDIDEEAALLHELKNIILTFIRQIKNYDYTCETDIKRLFEMVNEVEQQISAVNTENEPATFGDLLGITAKLEKFPDIRIVRLPAMVMLLSPYGDPEAKEGLLQDFYAWVKRELLMGEDEYPYGGGVPLFLWDGGQGFQFLVKQPGGCQGTGGWSEYRFPGGLYAVFASWLPEMMDRYQSVLRWLAASPLYEFDEAAAGQGRYPMGHIITPSDLMPLLKNEQQDVFVPICLRHA